jgi:hypothetical protein
MAPHTIALMLIVPVLAVSLISSEQKGHFFIAVPLKHKTPLCFQKWGFDNIINNSAAVYFLIF